MSEENNNVLIVITHGKDNLERAAVGFAAVNAALAQDYNVTVYLMFDGVELAKKGVIDTIKMEEGEPDLPQLFKNAIELGADIYLCGPCCNKRGITDNDIVEGTKIGGAANLVNTALTSGTLIF